MKVLAIAASALLLTAGCSSSNNSGGTGGSGQGGTLAGGKGGATDSITFTRTAARFIQIKATMSLVTLHPTSGDKYWAIGEFNAFP